MSISSWLKRPGPSGYGSSSTAEEVTAGLDLSGKSVLLTGSSSGIGRETLRVLSRRGAHVIATARTREKAEATCAEVARGETTPLACELEDPASIRSCVEAVRGLGRPLAAIVCNAGIMALPKLEVTHGVEKQIFTNHVGHFILVTGLLEQLAESGRVVMVSSTAHRMTPRTGIDFDNLDGSRGYRPWQFYGQSKLANLLFARALARRLASGRTANAVHPGVINTNLQRSLPGWMKGLLGAVEPLVLKSIPQGAATQCYVAAHPAVAGVSGEYFADCNVATTTPQGRDDKLAEQLWEVTERIVADLP